MHGVRPLKLTPCNGGSSGALVFWAHIDFFPRGRSAPVGPIISLIFFFVDDLSFVFVVLPLLSFDCNNSPALAIVSPSSPRASPFLKTDR